MLIHRDIEDQITKYINNKKAVVIYGARQVGKTTLAKSLAKKYSSALFINCDDPSNISLLSNVTLDGLRNLTTGFDCMVIDEAQKIANIGNAGKMIVDNKLVKQLIITGSSSLDLANTIKEPMTGRIFEFFLYPISYKELKSYKSPGSPIFLDNLLIHGSYPEIVTSSSQVAEKIIKQITSQYTFKDILELADIRDPALLRKLLTALALQLGNEVSYNELSNSLEVSRPTIERYLWLLEESFIIYRLNALTGNPRKLLSNRKRKFYFNDLGIRNALIDNFNPLELRNDIGSLFENFCINERRKLFANQDKSNSIYYYRSAKIQAEIDYVEENNGIKSAYEFKWKSSKYKVPTEFIAKYPNTDFKLINSSNYIDFVTKI